MQVGLGLEVLELQLDVLRDAGLVPLQVNFPALPRK